VSALGYGLVSIAGFSIGSGVVLLLKSPRRSRLPARTSRKRRIDAPLRLASGFAAAAGFFVTESFVPGPELATIAAITFFLGALRSILPRLPRLIFGALLLAFLILTRLSVVLWGIQPAEAAVFSVSLNPEGVPSLRYGQLTEWGRVPLDDALPCGPFWVGLRAVQSGSLSGAPILPSETMDADSLAPVRLAGGRIELDFEYAVRSEPAWWLPSGPYLRLTVAPGGDENEVCAVRVAAQLRALLRTVGLWTEVSCTLALPPPPLFAPAGRYLVVIQR